MDAFWQLARRMLRYRALLVTAILCSMVSAGGIGVGIGASKVVLDQIAAPEGERKGLPDFGAEINTHLPIGLQIVGRTGADALVLRAAYRPGG